MSQGFVSLLEAPMGGGKTVTCTSFMIDDYFKHTFGIENKGMPSRSYDVSFLKMSLGGPIFQVKKEDNRPVLLPTTYKTFSTTKIICNYHLYGVSYMYAPMSKVLDYINTPILKDAKWAIDEGWLVGESRKGMNPLVVFITEYAQLMRKLNVDLYWMTQHSRFLDWRIRYITKRKILTAYNEKTHQCKLLIQNLEKGTEKQVHYYAPMYWRYYNTYELPPMPEMSIAKARLYT